MWKHSFWHSETCEEYVWFSIFYSNSAQGNVKTETVFVPNLAKTERVSLDTYVKRDTDLNMNLQSPSFQNEPLCKQEKRVGKVHLRRRKLFSVSDVCAALEGSCTLPPIRGLENRCHPQIRGLENSCHPPIRGLENRCHPQIRGLKKVKGLSMFLTHTLHLRTQKTFWQHEE